MNLPILAMATNMDHVDNDGVALRSVRSGARVSPSRSRCGKASYDNLAPPRPANDMSRGFACASLQGADPLRQLQQLISEQWCETHLCEARGVDGMQERSFCHALWRHHFNVGGPADSSFRILNDSADDLHLLDLVSKVGVAALRTLPDDLYFEPRPPEGFQISRGGSRGAHIDREHLGDLILTVTLRGDCHICVEQPSDRTRHLRFCQRPSDFYAIWSDYRNFPNRHAVISGHQPRVSITLRFVHGQPPRAPPTSTSWMRSNPVLVKNYSTGEQYFAKISKADNPARVCDVVREYGRDRTPHTVRFSDIRDPDASPVNKAARNLDQRADRAARFKRPHAC